MKEALIIVVFGRPGSGKTYFASRLAHSIGAIHLSSDEIRHQLLRHRTYTIDEKRMVYDRLFDTTMRLAYSGKSVVLDATFYKAALRQKLENSARSLGISPIYIEVKADLSIIKERLAWKREYSEADYAVYEKVSRAFEPLDKPHLVLDSERQITDMLDEAIAYLELHLETLKMSD
ncbi:MAG: AAA family ATPase [Bacteroidota bacterium]